jgi:hypothetical protein
MIPSCGNWPRERVKVHLPQETQFEVVGAAILSTISGARMRTIRFDAAYIAGNCPEI